MGEVGTGTLSGGLTVPFFLGTTMMLVGFEEDSTPAPRFAALLPATVGVPCGLDAELALA